MSEQTFKVHLATMGKRCLSMEAAASVAPPSEAVSHQGRKSATREVRNELNRLSGSPLAQTTRTFSHAGASPRSKAAHADRRVRAGPVG